MPSYRRAGAWRPRPPRRPKARSFSTTITGQKKDNFTWKTPSAWAEGSFISSMKHVGQALQVRLEIDRLFDQAGQTGDPTPLIAICGDFNAKSDEVPLQAICGQVEDTGNPAHGPRVMVACENQVAESARYSLFHLGQGEMIDHVLASRALLATLDHTEIHNEYLPDESGRYSLWISGCSPGWPTAPGRRGRDRSSRLGPSGSVSIGPTRPAWFSQARMTRGPWAGCQCVHLPADRLQGDLVAFGVEVAAHRDQRRRVAGLGLVEEPVDLQPDLKSVSWRR